MAPFWIVDVLIYSPQNQCFILDPLVFLSLQTTLILFGDERIYDIYTEWNNKWMKLLIKAPVLVKFVNYFCRWLCLVVMRQSLQSSLIS